MSDPRKKKYLVDKLLILQKLDTYFSHAKSHPNHELYIESLEMEINLAHVKLETESDPIKIAKLQGNISAVRNILFTSDNLKKKISRVERQIEEFKNG